MIVSTTDPISLVEIQNPESHPYVIEGNGDNALKIYFEDEENRQAYLSIDLNFSDDDVDIDSDNAT